MTRPHLAKDLNVPLEQVVLAPGNHDVDRDEAIRFPNAIAAKQQGRVGWHDKFHRFLDFSSHFNGRAAFRLDRPYHLVLIGNTTAIVAFNSCIPEGDPNARCPRCRKEHYSGWLDPADIELAGAELDDRKFAGRRIAVLHHHIGSRSQRRSPTACIGTGLRNYFGPDWLMHTFSEHHFDLILHGHRHLMQLRQPQTPGVAVPLSFGSGTIWVEDNCRQEEAGYLLLQFPRPPAQSLVIMRKYRPATDLQKSRWVADDRINADGIISLQRYL